MMTYDIIKWAHVVSIIAWMAGLLYLPRLFVYHSMSGDDKTVSDLLTIMERRLLKAIMTPAMMSSWVTGVVLVWWSQSYLSLWFIIKFGCVIVLTAAHVVMKKHAVLFARGENQKRHVYFRILNEIPTVLMMAIVFMVIVKPFS